jgi:hypothetical protein
VLNPSDVAAIQAAGPNALPGPKLSVAVSAGSLVVSWPGNVTGLTLKSTTNLKGGTWSAVGTSPVLSGGNYQVTLPLSGTAQFFRLSQ